MLNVVANRINAVGVDQSVGAERLVQQYLYLRFDIHLARISQFFCGELGKLSALFLGENFSDHRFGRFYDKTGKLVSGSRDKEKFMVYEWDLVRTSGTKTEKDKPMQPVNCPNCGAPVEITASAKCPYCGSVITLEEHDFALNAIRAISQQTRG